MLPFGSLRFKSQGAKPGIDLKVPRHEVENIPIGLLAYLRFEGGTWGGCQPRTSTSRHLDEAALRSGHGFLRSLHDRNDRDGGGFWVCVRIPWGPPTGSHDVPWLRIHQRNNTNAHLKRDGSDLQGSTSLEFGAFQMVQHAVPHTRPPKNHGSVTMTPWKDDFPLPRGG